MSVFGSMVSESGDKCHWRIKLRDDDHDKLVDINIGVIQADECRECWWTTVGISYYSWTGDIFQYDESTKQCEVHYYEELFDDTDEVIIDIWLDMRDKCQLSFAKHGTNFGKATDIKESMKYRLAISASNTKVEILFYEAQ